MPEPATITVRTNRELLDKIQRLAEERRWSVNTLINVLMEEATK